MKCLWLEPILDGTGRNSFDSRSRPQTKVNILNKTSIRQRKALAATALGAFALTSTLALAAPAQATPPTPFNGCTVAVADPAYRETSPQGDKRYNYSYKIKCDKGRYVTYQHQAFQARGDGYQKRGDNTRASSHYTNTSTKNFNFWYTLKDYKPGRENVYHQVRIKVHGDGGVTSDWSPWYKSPVVSVSN
jgi:hypothetical protein